MTTDDQAVPALVVDERDALLRADLLDGDVVLDVLWNDHRVWSVRSGDLLREGNYLVLRWPAALAGYALGRGAIAVAVHGQAEPLACTDVRLGDSPGLLQLCDESGRWLAVNKWGRLGATFEKSGPSDELHAATARVLRLLVDDCSVQAFITYGSLLGAVRSGQSIAHDDDIDLGYLSEHSNPSDVVLESFLIERKLTAAGLGVRRLSGGHLQLLIELALRQQPAHLDVFTSFLTGGHLHQAFAVRAPMTVQDVLPLAAVSLDGRSYPAPRNPDLWLAATYGPHWRTPDPSFRYAVPPGTGRRFFGWLGDVNMHREYWDEFYRARAVDFVPGTPSPFSGWVRPQLTQDVLVEIGCGTGRDGLWFAEQGHRVVGVDYADAAVAECNARAAARTLDARFQVCNLYETRDMLALVDELAGRRPDVYARFLLHSLEDRGRANLLRVLRGLLTGGGRAFLEFRTDADAAARHVLEDHFRRYVSLAEVCREVEAAGLRVDHCEEGPGFAPYREEDPVCARMVISCA